MHSEGHGLELVCGEHLDNFFENNLCKNRRCFHPRKQQIHYANDLWRLCSSLSYSDSIIIYKFETNLKELQDI